jgi:YfiR/HmsC-like
VVKARRAAAALLLMGATAPALGLETEAASEYRLKAVFLYNFAKFVQWPPEPQAEGGAFVIGILGRDPFGSTLDATMEGKSVEERKIVVRRVTRAEDLRSCRILFISSSERERLSGIFKQVGGDAILTVGETTGFAEKGGVIRFRVEGDRVRLEINVAAAERSRLKISSQLLRLAQIVGPARGD